MNEIKILFVCLGNICRSPTAHGFFQKMVEDEGLQKRIVVDSAGTSSWHIGEPPDSRTVATAQSRGVDLSALRGRQLQKSDLDEFDYVLAMDKDNLSNIERFCSPQSKAKTGLFLSYAKNSDLIEVPDPYHGGQGGFDHVFDLVVDACEGLMDHLRKKYSL